LDTTAKLVRFLAPQQQQDLSSRLDTTAKLVRFLAPQQQQDLSSRLDTTAKPISTTMNTNNTLPDEEYFRDRDKCEVTSYVVDCMATDGTNIFYSCIVKEEHDLIAYCYLDPCADLYGKTDPSRPWLLPTITDMIWWNCIGKFVCATKNAVITVEYQNKRFKILTVLSGCEADMQIAANSTELWVNCQGKTFVYNKNFVLIQSIKYYIEPGIVRKSLCITENAAALLITRNDKTQENILQIRFYDTKMKLTKSYDLGVSSSPCMVRSDGKDRFYITDGTDWLYIMSSNGRKQLVKLDDDASCLAVINKRNIVLSDSRTDVELVHVPKFY